jgi:REP element-mobilizing transposase RayT
MNSRTLFGGSDCRLDRDWLGIAAAKVSAEIWAYCLMPNHAYAVVVTPKDEADLRRSFPRFSVNRYDREAL